MAVLHYGADSSVRLEFADGVAADLCGTPRGTALGDPAAAVAAALEQPLDYPPLAKTATPGDRVVLVLDHALPQAAGVTAAVIRLLVAAGVEPDGISILRTEAAAPRRRENPCSLLDETLRARITTVTHDPSDRDCLAYLAANDEGEPIVLNRLLTDADVVLPIGCLQNEAATGYFGIHTPLFPTFSDQQTQARFRRLDVLGGEGPAKRKLRGEVEQTAWLLGVNFTVQVVPAAGDRLLDVVAGQCDAVRRRGRQLYDEAWSWRVARRASLVVAAIEGGPRSRPGKTSAAPWRPPTPWSKTAAPSPSAAIWPPLPARACRPSPPPARATRPCGSSARIAPPTPSPPRNWPGPSTTTRSICSAGSIRAWSRTWT